MLHDNMTKQEPFGNGWNKFSVRRRLLMNCRGWSGLADRLVAWWTKKPQRSVVVEYEASVYAKDGEISILIWGEQFTEGPDIKTEGAKLVKHDLAGNKTVLHPKEEE